MKTKANVAAAPCKCSRSAAGEIKVGIVEPALGLRPARMVWLSANEVIARFGVERGAELVARARESVEST
jgi:hypothetical protein